MIIYILLITTVISRVALSIVTRIQVGTQFPARARDFLFPTASTSELETAQPPTQWVPGPLSQGLSKGV
jgi:hypothetical protein